MKVTGAAIGTVAARKKIRPRSRIGNFLKWRGSAAAQVLYIILRHYKNYIPSLFSLPFSVKSMRQIIYFKIKYFALQLSFL
jgi:hypothetical protein